MDRGAAPKVKTHTANIAQGNDLVLPNQISGSKNH